MSVATADKMYDPTMQGCNAWVFCTNPEGCVNGKKTMPGLSCTLKRIPLDNPDIQEQMRRQSSRDGPPAGLVAEGGGDFVFKVRADHWPPEHYRRLIGREVPI